ncbi:MAG: carboxypeptidase-like regulatory domain-containing protein, partial [Bacteroides ovatus]|nr:carboxypeptidase-like regulatory domain-containing protein [Bacteroides ovatus]
FTLSYKKATGRGMWMKAAFLLLMFVTALHGWAQESDSKLISLELKNVSLGEALKQFSNVSGYKVNFSSEDVNSYRVSVSIHQLAPLSALQKILEGKPFEYEVNQHFITIRKMKTTSTGVVRKVRNIEGRIVDEKGTPLPGANIRGIDSPFGAIANAEGYFTCKVLAETHTLEVSFVGMQTEKISIKGRTNINVVMHEDKQQLGDVVVTGYQRISRERSTASFGFIDSEQLTRQMHSDLASSLEG